MDIDLPKQLKFGCFRPKVINIDLPKHLKFSCFQPKVMNIDLPKGRVAATLKGRCRGPCVHIGPGRPSRSLGHRGRRRLARVSARERLCPGGSGTLRRGPCSPLGGAKPRRDAVQPRTVAVSRHALGSPLGLPAPRFPESVRALAGGGCRGRAYCWSIEGK